ncbi:quinolinate synthetase [Rhodovulum imhoffii]|uniref:Quinolinate synthase n=1 Tax=Rhodovulum imhoffii TaxID=365340 RepID=A0A2T5BWM6_9RHOB|nr:quinolinate synthase NadA [Rhodovulum imhoffii]MBK5932482.1 quinolinate synthase [Rhodovulum imhoffii]PTN04039.1 quinolinate synthetase [Rhodovulum imhoffii]
MLDTDSAADDLAEIYDLAPSLEKAEATRDIHARVAHVIPWADWAIHAPYIVAINALKKTRNAVILGHNYMAPEIFHGVSDFVGDSLQLAIEATRTEAEVIVQCGVHFMAETSKVLNPSRTVLIPDMGAGCSLAESVTPEDIAALRARHPGAPVVSYVNTSAAVKAVSDICCTSANALRVVDAMEGDTVIMAPDRFLAQNVARESSKKVVWAEGACMVHELFTPEDLREWRAQEPDGKIIAHPECPPEVVAEADFSGSTSGMVTWLRDHRAQKALLVTECSMAANVAGDLPEVSFAKPCNLCPHMQKITLPKILHALHYGEDEVTVDPALAEKAARAVQRMIDLG